MATVKTPLVKKWVAPADISTKSNTRSGFDRKEFTIYHENFKVVITITNHAKKFSGKRYQDDNYRATFTNMLVIDKTNKTNIEPYFESTFRATALDKYQYAATTKFGAKRGAIRHTVADVLKQANGLFGIHGKIIRGKVWKEVLPGVAKNIAKTIKPRCDFIHRHGKLARELARTSSSDVRAAGANSLYTFSNITKALKRALEFFAAGDLLLANCRLDFVEPLLARVTPEVVKAPKKSKSKKVAASNNILAGTTYETTKAIYKDLAANKPLKLTKAEEKLLGKPIVKRLRLTEKIIKCMKKKGPLHLIDLVIQLKKLGWKSTYETPTKELADFFAWDSLQSHPAFELVDDNRPYQYFVADQPA